MASDPAALHPSDPSNRASHLSSVIARKPSASMGPAGHRHPLPGLIWETSLWGSVTHTTRLWSAQQVTRETGKKRCIKFSVHMHSEVLRYICCWVSKLEPSMPAPMIGRGRRLPSLQAAIGPAPLFAPLAHNASRQHAKNTITHSTLVPVHSQIMSRTLSYHNHAAY